MDITKMSLYELIVNDMTDKNTTHSYLDTYERLFNHLRHKAKNVLEIGIYNGGSMKLWFDYFQNATIYGVDINDENCIWYDVKGRNRIKLLTSCDGYEPTFFLENFVAKNIRFDAIVDDGPHTLESMKTFILYYSSLLTEDGVLVIEDVQYIDWVNELKEIVPENLKQYIEVYDLRNVKNRYDDIMFVINKNKTFQNGILTYVF
jgi:hypothetical protein